MSPGVWFRAVFPWGAVVALACGASATRDEGPPRAVVTSPAPSPGRVEIRIAADPIAVGAPVRFAVANGLSSSLFTEDQKSACSIAVIERERQSGWEPRLGCNLERIAAVVEIRPGEARADAIDPRSTHFDLPPGSPTPAFGAGRYRLKFSYRLARSPEGEEPHTVHSVPFRIGP